MMKQTMPLTDHVKRERRLAISLFFVFAGSWLIRVNQLTTIPGSWDAVDFALALERYDIFAMQPHFPGYPLFIVVAKWCNLLFNDPVYSLSFVSACFGSLSIFPFYGWVSHMTRHQAIRFWALLLFAANPLLWLTHLQPMSESMALFFVLLLFYIISFSLHYPIGDRVHFHIAIWAVLVFVLIMGVRFSYFPLASLLMLPLYRMNPFSGRGMARIGCVMLIGSALLFVIIWLTAATEGGWAAYWKLGTAFTKGHFTEWGGTVFTSEQSDFFRYGYRVKQWFWDLGLGAGWLGTTFNGWTVWTVLQLPFLCISFIGWLKLIATIRREYVFHNKQMILVLLAVIPYALWIFIGQNPDKPRHILPLVSIVILAVVTGWQYFRNRTFGMARVMGISAAILALTGAGGQGYDLAKSNQQPSPELKMVQYVSDTYSADQVVIFTWEEERIFHYSQPKYMTQRLKSYDRFQALAEDYYRSGKTILITNKVLEGFAREDIYHQVKLRAYFAGNAIVYPVYDQIMLYEWSP